MKKIIMTLFIFISIFNFSKEITIKDIGKIDLPNDFKISDEASENGEKMVNLYSNERFIAITLYRVKMPFNVILDFEKEYFGKVLNTHPELVNEEYRKIKDNHLEFKLVAYQLATNHNLSELGIPAISSTWFYRLGDCYKDNDDYSYCFITSYANGDEDKTLIEKIRKSFVPQYLSKSKVKN